MDDLFIVELLAGKDAPPYKYSLPKTKAEAEALVATYSVEGIYPRIVPAEKYAPKIRAERVERPEDVSPNANRSRVE